MGQFNVGDVVRIKPLSGDMPFSTNPEMDSLKGEVFAIVEVTKGAYNKKYHSKYLCDECKYELSGRAGRWNWSNPMLELVSQQDYYSVKVDAGALSALPGERWNYFAEMAKAAMSAYLKKTKGEPLRLAVKHNTIKLNFKN